MTTPTKEQVSKLFKAALDKRREMSEESKGDLARWLFSEGMVVARADLEATISQLQNRCANLLDLKDAALAVIKEGEAIIAEQAAEIARLGRLARIEEIASANCAHKDEADELRQRLEEQSAELDVTKDNLTTAIYANERFHEMNETLKAELESLRKDVEPVAWGISVEGEMCDVFINKDACFLEFERRNKLYPEIPRVVVNLVIAAAPKQEK